MTRKISIRVPVELMGWIEMEASRRCCDITAVIVDAIRLSAAAGKIEQQQLQTNNLLAEILPLFTKRFDQLENYAVQVVYSSGALAKQAGVFDQAQAGFNTWKAKKGEHK